MRALWRWNRVRKEVRSSFLPLFSLLLLLGIIWGAGLSEYAVMAAEPAVVVTLTDRLTYMPKRVTIQVGETVEWHNRSLLVHTVTADPDVAARREDVALPPGAQPFNSGNLKPGEVFRHTFTIPGTYRYFCIPHEGAGMVGEVVVRPAGGS